MKNSIKQTVSFVLILIFFGFSTIIKAQTDEKKDRIYVKIEIKGMACPYCAFGMEKELRKVFGVYNVKIELEAGLAFISTPIQQKPTKESIQKIIMDAGFTVGDIEYSTKPFVTKEPRK
ncbi:MAG: hypothetical protein COC16_02825 [Lutibacter sp.]|nr:MAG: hypothetical protein COC16_02825 [Lutibacter sp.]